MSYFQIIWITFKLLPLHCLGGFDRWSRRNKRHLSMRKTLLGNQSFHPFSPNPGIDWIFWTPAWHFDFTSYYIRLSPPDCLSPWSSWSIIILSFIMPNVAQWSLIVISQSKRSPSIENLFSWQNLSKMIDLLIPVLTRDNVLSSYKNIWLATFGPIEISQSNV